MSNVTTTRPHTSSCASSISSLNQVNGGVVGGGIALTPPTPKMMIETGNEDRLSAVSSVATTSKYVVREVLEKDPKERTDDDIDLLFEFMQTLPVSPRD